MVAILRTVKEMADELYNKNGQKNPIYWEVDPIKADVTVSKCLDGWLITTNATTKFQMERDTKHVGWDKLWEAAGINKYTEEEKPKVKLGLVCKI